ncbi:DNA polymerase III subunit delta [Acetivibrio cellulolyticus]|uniref:DNA polymerase III subunit delta n=1 Tax=Acetivibrio cellulolyticus TaxID=35830 RepID=UPI0001E2D8B9|nr:DNA polymerase III subunit delta [Acetivibrio cellulolyticus]
MSIDVLKEELKNNKLGNLYLFYGHEEFLKKYYLESIEKAILDNDLSMLNKIVLEGKFEMQKIEDACETLPVFSEKKLVLVKNSGVFKSGKEGAKQQSAKDDLQNYLKNVPAYTVVVFYEEEIDKRLKTVDAVKKNGLIVEFAFQKPAELVKWVTKVLKSNKKEITIEDASYLIEICEQGMTEILNEVNKLVMYVGDRTRVTIEDIEKVCTKSVKSRIFDLTDAVAEKNIDKALKLLNDMVILREPLPKILFMITRQLRHVLEMKLLCKEGLSVKDASAKIGITPYAGGKVSNQAKSFSIEKLKEGIKEAFELDLAIKTGRINDRIAAELLINKLGNG